MGRLSFGWGAYFVSSPTIVWLHNFNLKQRSRRLGCIPLHPRFGRSIHHQRVITGPHQRQRFIRRAFGPLRILPASALEADDDQQRFNDNKE